MSKKITGAHSAKEVRDEEVKIQVDQQYFRHVDQIQRWRNQYDYSQAVESKLAELSNLSFEPVDYLSMLEKVPFVEQEIPNFDYLVIEAKEATEKRFVMPMVQRIVVAVFGLLGLILGMDALMLWISGTAIATVMVSVYLLLQNRETEIVAAMDAAKAEIERRSDSIRKLNEQARSVHEENENKRICAIEKLMVGEIGSIILKIDVTVSQMKLPLVLQVDVDIYVNVPLIKVWLPTKAIIPEQICELLPSGRVKYEEKDSRAINKQYVELCAALLIQITAVIYENVPSFNRGYISGISKNGLTNECVISVSFEREALAEICNRATNAITAIRGLGGLLECDTALNLLPVAPPVPEEWGVVQQKEVRSIAVRIDNDK